MTVVGLPEPGTIVNRRKQALRLTNAPELQEAARELASLALEKQSRDGVLVVRQREQLRRALATAADVLDWGEIPGAEKDRVAAATRDVAELAEAGARALEQDLAELLTMKENEITQLKEAARSVRALAGDENTTYPAEIEYSHTVRDSARHLVTRVETVVLNDAGEAESASSKIEKGFEGAAKLRDQMVEVLKQRQREIHEVRGDLRLFADGSSGLLLEVLETRRV